MTFHESTFFRESWEGIPLKLIFDDPIVGVEISNVVIMIPIYQDHWTYESLLSITFRYFHKVVDPKAQALYFDSCGCPIILIFVGVINVLGSLYPMVGTIDILILKAFSRESHKKWSSHLKNSLHIS